jgi:carboxyl-terminal processing protease
MFRRNLIVIIILSISFLNFSLRDCLAKESEQKDNFYEEIELFADTLAIIRSEYVDETKMKDLIYGALEGMLSSLDPYSQFMDPDTYNEVKVETEGEFGGLGIEITIKDGMLMIITPLDDTPAYKAGLKAGDRIVKIDDKLTKNITLLEAVKKLRGKPGTEVKLTIMREGEKELLDFTIKRGIIKIKSIKEARILEDNIGYIRIAEFQENTPQDLEKALLDLEKQHMEGLILDLRNNPGGLLDVAVKVVDKFIDKGKVVVTTQGRIKSQNLEFKSHFSPHPHYPLVVLVNGGSASGSEIVAGAIQDHKRGILLGTKTFGKGSVQTIIPLKDGSALRLTTSKYFTPKGRAIHEKGIIPDVVVELREEKIVKKEKRNIFEDIEKNKLKEKKKEIVYDNQLNRALDLLKGIRAYQGLVSNGS